MKTNTLFLTISVLFFSLTSHSAESGKPRDMVNSTIRTVVGTLKSTKLDRNTKKTIVMKKVDDIFNLELIAKLSIGKKVWKDLDSKLRKQFTDVFVDHLKESYFSKIELLSDEEVIIQDEIKVGTKIHIPTKVQAKDKTYTVIYKLHQNSNEWKIYDVEIEGISLVKSYSLQFKQFLAKKGIHDLILELKNKKNNGEKVATTN